MHDDDEVCLCFHVTRRKVIAFIRTRKPKLVSQISECQGAGTGCGWCRKLLAQILDQQLRNSTVLNAGAALGQPSGEDAPTEPSGESHRLGREAYLKLRDANAAPNDASASPISADASAGSTNIVADSQSGDSLDQRRD